MDHGAEEPACPILKPVRNAEKAPSLDMLDRQLKHFVSVQVVMLTAVELLDCYPTQSLLYVRRWARLFNLV